jgi:SAM-dependent methyltransferase
MHAMAANQAQAEYWISPAGLKWIEHEQILDAAMAGLSDVMLDAAAITARERVIDIGCGTGASTIAAAGRAAPGEVIGVDIAMPLLARARHRATAAGVRNAAFLLADAQTHGFAEGAFDVLVSRIGMSFFAAPLSAFRNLARALRDDGRMAFVCWAGVAENPWFDLPRRAAEERLGMIPGGDPLAPGPVAFQDRARVVALMAEAGLSDIEAQAVEIDLTPSGGVAGAARAASRVGPAARIVKARNGDETDATAIEHTVQRAFAVFDRDGDVRIPAVVNLFTCAR